MKLKLVLMLLSVSLIAVSAYAFLDHQTSSSVTRSLRADNITLREDLDIAKQSLAAFKDIDMTYVHKVCKEKATAAYSDYIRANSIALKEGNVTTFEPKSPEILKKAQATLDKENSSCDAKFGS